MHKYYQTLRDGLVILGNFQIKELLYWNGFVEELLGLKGIIFKELKELFFIIGLLRDSLNIKLSIQALFY